jgi:hypothetical protein
MFPVYGVSCLSRKAVHSRERSKVADDARPGAEVTVTTIKSLLCCRFRRTFKATRQVYHCWWRICREINASIGYHMFYVLYVFITCLLNPSYPTNESNFKIANVYHVMTRYIA